LQNAACVSAAPQARNILVRRSNVDTGGEGDRQGDNNQPAPSVDDTGTSSPAKPMEGTAKGRTNQAKPKGTGRQSEAADADTQANKQALDRERVRRARARRSVKLSRFLTLDAARTWLPGDTPAHIDRVGAFRVLAGLWDGYGAPAEWLRKLTAPGGCCSIGSGSGGRRSPCASARGSAGCCGSSRA
jgi:hypothetical protein